MASETPGKNRLLHVTEQVVATYSQIGTINHLGHSPLPHNDAVIGITHDLMEVIYPGYQRRQKLHAGNVAYHVGDLLEGLNDALTLQIARALRHEQALANSGDPQSDEANDAFEDLARQKAIALLESLPRLRELLATPTTSQAAGATTFSGNCTSGNSSTSSWSGKAERLRPS